jgi:hypothetical protein
MGGGERQSDGAWRFASRLGFAWRKAQSELFDCEVHEMGEMVDELGVLVMRLGDALRPSPGLAAGANLKKSRPEVQVAAELLAAIAGAVPAEGVAYDAPRTPSSRRRCLAKDVSAPPLPRPGVMRLNVRFKDEVEYGSVPARLTTPVAVAAPAPVVLASLGGGAATAGGGGDGLGSAASSSDGGRPSGAAAAAAVQVEERILKGPYDDSDDEDGVDPPLSAEDLEMIGHAGITMDVSGGFVVSVEAMDDDDDEGLVEAGASSSRLEDMMMMMMMQKEFAHVWKKQEVMMQECVDSVSASVSRLEVGCK